jgi:uncharacterized protein DUF4394
MKFDMNRVVAGGAILTLVFAGAPGGALASRAGVGAATCGPGVALDVIGLTSDQRIVCFESNDPAGAATIGAVTGLTGDTTLVGIDFRPATAVLYGVGNGGGIYTIDTDTAVATMVSQLSVALAGTSFGVDFNPVPDRLRIISDTGQSLRHDVTFPAPPTAVDGTLSYPPPAPPALGVAGAAYTNNDADPNTATTLFDVDSNLDQVAIQSPANSGQLAPTGKLLVNTSSALGFDIFTTTFGGTTVFNDAYASLTVAISTGTRTGFYGVDLLTGRARRIGFFNPADEMIDIAFPLIQIV